MRIRSSVIPSTQVVDSQRREATRDAILDATDRLLARYGFRKMTVEDIAREAGIGKGSVYLHFTSKEDVVLSHVDRIVERLVARLWEIAQTDSPAPARLRKMVMTRVLFRFDSVQHYTQSLNELLSALRPGLLARRARYFDDEASVFAEVLSQGCSTGELVRLDPLSSAYTMLHATNALLPYSLSTAELGARDELEAKAGAVADLMLNGLIDRQFPVLAQAGDRSDSIL